MLLKVINDDRIKFVEKAKYHTAKKLRVEFPKMKIPDRFFLGIAINTINKILITEDFEDFSPANRNEIKRLFKTHVIQATEIFQP